MNVSKYEEQKALTRGIELAKENGADLVIVTDPDKDMIDKVNTTLLDPKTIACIIGVGVFSGELGASMAILPVVGRFLTHSGAIVLGSIVAYLSGDLIKGVIKSNNKEVK